MWNKISVASVSSLSSTQKSLADKDDDDTPKILKKEYKENAAE